MVQMSPLFMSHTLAERGMVHRSQSGRGGAAALGGAGRGRGRGAGGDGGGGTEGLGLAAGFLIALV